MGFLRLKDYGLKNKKTYRYIARFIEKFINFERTVPLEKKAGTIKGN